MTKQNVLFGLMGVIAASLGLYFFAPRGNNIDNNETLRHLDNMPKQVNNGPTQLASGEVGNIKEGEQVRMQMPSVKPTNVNQEPAGQTKIDPNKVTHIAFKEAKYNFGTIKTGEKVKHKFKFTNTGSKPLTITNAQASCGCTVADWPKDPIAPGASNEIIAVFDSKGKSGPQTKTITVTANTDPVQTIITLTGEVTGDPNAGQAPAPAKVH